jgi:hypothetical protein
MLLGFEIPVISVVEPDHEGTGADLSTDKRQVFIPPALSPFPPSVLAFLRR